jgi:uncharacterized YigZ family protein
MDTNPFLIPETTGEALVKSRGSKFIGLACPVKSLEEAKETLKNIRERYPDATHHCYAWVLGNQGQIQMASDDGEPSHSAGTPILNAIRSFQTVWTFVAVVRYYGGTKLGVPGLIEAYGEAAAQALLQAGRKSEVPRTIFILDFAYDTISFAEQLIHRFKGELIAKSFETGCRYSVSIPSKEADDFSSAVQEQSHRIRLHQAELGASG